MYIHIYIYIYTYDTTCIFLLTRILYQCAHTAHYASCTHTPVLFYTYHYTLYLYIYSVNRTLRPYLDKYALEAEIVPLDSFLCRAQLEGECRVMTYTLPDQKSKYNMLCVCHNICIHNTLYMHVMVYFYFID